MSVEDAIMAEADIPLGYGDEETPLGSSLPERVLQELLAFGLAKIHADPSLCDDLFWKLDEAAKADIHGYFADHAIPVRLDFPIDDWTFPLVTIQVASDDENVAGDFLGDYMTTQPNTLGGSVDMMMGHALKSIYTVYCLAGKDSNAAMWLYYVVKAILVLNAESLMRQGLHNLTMSGRDISFQEQTLPEMTYARTLSLTCDNYFCVRKSERVATSLVQTLYVEDAVRGNIDVEADEP